MSEIQKQAFYVASVMAARKEQAYKAAINFYFSGYDWDEDTLEEYAGSDIDPDGAEEFYIGDSRLIRFGPLQTTTLIEGDSVSCLYAQDIEVLY